MQLALDDHGIDDSANVVDGRVVDELNDAGIRVDFHFGDVGPAAHAWLDTLARARQGWWQILPLGPPDKHGSPYTAASAFAAWNGLLADPSANVTAAEIESFVARHPYWAGDWAAFAGAGALADQVRFEREWSALRRYASRKRVQLLGDVPIYVAPGSADHASHPELFLEDDVAAQATQVFIEYDPEPPFDAGHPTKVGDDVMTRVREYRRSRR